MVLVYYKTCPRLLIARPVLQTRLFPRNVPKMRMVAVVVMRMRIGKREAIASLYTPNGTIASFAPTVASSSKGIWPAGAFALCP